MDKQDFDEFRQQFENFPFRRARNIVLVVIILVLVIAVPTTMFYQVEPEEVGVVQRFGKILTMTIKRPDGTEERVPDYSSPGLHWKLPFGIDRVDKIPITLIIKEEFGFRTPQRGMRTRRVSARGYDVESLMLTGDLNIADVEWIVQFRIKEPADYLFKVRNPEETLRDVSESAMRLVVGDYSITDVLTEQRAGIQQEVQERIQSVLDLYESGIEVTTVKLQDVNPPESVKPSFDGVNEARLEKETTINQARREYFQQIPEARGLAQKMVAEAKGYRAKRVNEAKGNVAKFQALLKEYKQSPEVTRTRLYLEALAQVIPEMNHIYIVDEEQAGPLQVLDLKQAAAGWRQRSGEDADEASAPAGNTASNKTGPRTFRSK